MASPDILRQAIAGIGSADRTANRSQSSLPAPGTSKVWMLWDGVTVVAASAVAVMFEFRMGLMDGLHNFLQGTLFPAQSQGVLISLLCGFTLAYLLICQRMGLYSPNRLVSFLHEQRLTFQASATGGLLLTAAIYVLHALQIPRLVVLITLALITVSVSARRMLFRVLRNRRLSQGIGTRNLLIVGTGQEAQSVRRQVDTLRHLGFTFRGFIEAPSLGVPRSAVANASEILGTLDSLFERARKHFIDEILFTVPIDHQDMQEILLKARDSGVDLRVLPSTFGGLTLNCPIEYVGQFPTIPIHRGELPEVALMLKRGMDLLLSSCILLALSPLLLIIAILIRLGSPGPVFYRSDRIGKKGRVFKCLKFRTMVADADRRRADLMHLNERDGVLFKIANDPRVTRLGRTLRKYSLDELPQFFNVLKGDMSIVGPRPPVGSEVTQYKLDHLRRLDVTPGITGLWQVQARQDPSFDSYISLDLAYVENWNIWLDLRIILRTIGVVFAGTGS